MQRKLALLSIFIGIGIDGCATGVVLTAAYVKIVQLRLEKMGTVDTKLIQLETKCMPLLSKASFEKWVEGRESNWENFKRDLYGDGTTGVANNALVPSGLVAIWNLMTSSRVHLVGPSPFVSGAIDDRIGCGAFSTAHAARNNDRQVIKVSRHGATATLEREAKVLKKLQTPSAGIVQLVEYKDLSVEFGGISIPMPALILTPFGISAEMHLASQVNKDKKKTLLKIGKELVAALDFIHGQGYNHNDISPKNILFDRFGGKAFLIDFGLASHHSETMKGFCGTPRYAHRGVFGMYKGNEWKAEPVYDKSSLAYSLADLSRSTVKHLWKSFQPFDLSADENAEEKVDFNAWVEKRSSTAWSLLEEGGFSDGEFAWKSWCFHGDE